MAQAEIIVGTVARVTGTIEDDQGTAITADTLIWTLYAIDGDTKTIINGRNNTVRTPPTSGALSHVLTIADNVMANANNESEVHRIRYKWTYTGGGVGIDYVTFTVKKDEAPTS